MDTTILGGGVQCMDIVTAGLMALATLAIAVMTGVYGLAGICKRIR